MVGVLALSLSSHSLLYPVKTHCGACLATWQRYQMMGYGDWDACGELHTVRCADCQSMVPDCDGMNKRRILIVALCELPCSSPFEQSLEQLRNILEAECQKETLTCRYRFILMRANTTKETTVVSLIEFNDFIRVLSLLFFSYQGTFYIKTFIFYLTFIRKTQVLMW